VATYAGNPRFVVDTLIERAIAVGKDNVSVVFVEGAAFSPRFSSLPAPAFSPKSPLPAPFDPDITAPNLAPRAEVPAVAGAQELPAPKQASKNRRWPAALLWFALGAAILWTAEHAQELTRRVMRTAMPPRDIQVDAQGQGGLATIQAALDEAHPGDSIQLAPGVYREAVVLDKDLTISGSGASILPPENAGPVTAITVVKPAKVRLVNLSIAGNEAAGNLLEGVDIEGGSAVLQKLTITGAVRAGIEVNANGAATIEYSSLHDNAGPGAWIRGGASAVLRFNNSIGNGHGASNRAPGIAIDSTRPVEMLGNTFAENGAEAIWDVRLPSKQVLAGNLFTIEGRTGRAEDVKLVKPLVKPKDVR
jgi:hypothetical protein